MNNVDLEPKVQKMIKENQIAIKELRERENLGIIPPVYLKYDKDQGFYV